MAFIDFADAALQSPPLAQQMISPSVHTSTHASPHPSVAHVPMLQAEILPAQADLTLSALERRVVELARQDGLETLQPQRKRSWLARLILGPQPPSPMLADERLEALRRLAVQAWHKGYTLPASALREARLAGFSEVQVGAVVDAIGRARPAFRVGLRPELQPELHPQLRRTAA